MSLASDARFWDRSSRKYAASKIADPGGYERTLERTRALLRAGDSVLELGCGTGTTALRLADAVQAYLATDLSEGMIAIARQKLAAGPVASLAFRVATAEDLRGEADRFDAVLGFNYLHLVHDLPATLASIHGLVKPGGLFISKTPCLGDMTPLIRLVLLPAMRAIGKAPHVLSLRADDLEGAVRAAGFDVIAREAHATRGRDRRPFLVARKP
ncbi:class I SAM-dependent methyltransferase [Phreatobacter sp.]|uniref:class I SAM-dependent methyltransferase n=1 Tax=Phreatobacter sp. TaxID=1966341 RepID=UPI003F712A83